MEYRRLSSILKESGYILFRPYCRHYATPFFEGLTKIPKPEKIDPEFVALEQDQRRLERQIRKAKRLQVMGATDGDRAKATEKIKQWQGELRDITKKHNEIYRHYERENPYFTELHRLNRGVKLKFYE